MSVTYQGHLSDGSGIQRHSAGSNYPFVIVRRRSEERPWYVLAPCGTQVEFFTYDSAMDFACAAAVVYNIH